MDEQDVKIAVLENEVKGLREQQKAHKEEIKQSVDQVWGVVKDIRTDIKSIYEFINQSKGGLYITIIVASGVGGLVVSMMTWALGHYVK